MLNFLKVSFNISYIAFEFLNLQSKDSKSQKSASVKNLVLLEERIVQLLNKLKENHLLISQLSEENQGLEKQNLDFKEKVSHLKSENESLKVANSLLGSEESKAVTKRKINSLIKEVDFCIHQLTEIN